ncbi:hypothetical protein BOO21_19215 [Vibrio cidicii]|nr:hypothetical protein [Vibrio cidicii]
MAICSGSRQIGIVYQREFLAVASIEFFGLLEVSQFGAKSLWKFCFRFEFSENEFSKFTGFKANERLQSLSQFGFQNSSGL